MNMNMKKAVGIILVTAVAGLAVFCSRRGAEIKPVRGVLDGPLGIGEAPAAVREILKDAVPDDRYELILENLYGGVRVWVLMQCSEEIPSEGYGVLIARGHTFTAFPDIRHGNMPRATYDASSGELLLIGADMEGTGVLVERPWVFSFAEDGTASVTTTIDPYDLQQKLCERIGYSIMRRVRPPRGLQDVSIFADGKPLSIVTLQDEDMGGLWEEPVWIGEQICYDIKGPLKVMVTPGISYTVGKVLDYDVIPSIEATVTLTPESFSLDF